MDSQETKAEIFAKQLHGLYSLAGIITQTVTRYIGDFNSTFAPVPGARVLDIGFGPGSIIVRWASYSDELSYEETLQYLKDNPSEVQYTWIQYTDFDNWGNMMHTATVPASRVVQ